MALIIEDGTGKTGSQSYASESELAAYALARGITVTGTDSELLVKSMDYLEQQNFKGNKLTKEQALQWPRFDVWIDGYSIDTDEIPTLLKEAQMEYALSIDSGVDPSATVDRAVKREKVDGAVEVEYMDGASDTQYIKAAEQKLRKLIKAGSGVVVVRA
jgi:hypothetical protein